MGSGLKVWFHQCDAKILPLTSPPVTVEFRDILKVTVL